MDVSEPAEQEAERVAAEIADDNVDTQPRVSARPRAAVARHRKPGLSAVDDGGDVANTDVEAVDHVIRADSGSTLDDETRLRMELRFGHAFQRVRIHSDDAASRSAESIDALAYTKGTHVVFRAGHYQPGTSTGAHLLAHELTHVVQQSADAAPNHVQRQKVPPAAGAVADPAPASADAAIAAPSAAPVADATVDRAIKTGDPSAITAITDFTRVSESDRLRFIRILNPETSGAIAGGHITKIWHSFGDDRLPSIIMANRGEWDATVGRFGGDVMALLPHSLVTKSSTAFETDLKALAGSNLQRNQEFIDQRMQALGLKEGAQKPFAPEDITKVRRAVQEIAWSVWDMRQNQKKLEKTAIGRKLRKATFGISFLMGSEEEEVLFNPRIPPTNPE